MTDKTEVSEKTPSILIPALRQYQHNDCSGLLVGFDYKETIKIVTAIQARFVEQALEAINAIEEGPQPLVGNYHNGISKAEARQAIKDKFK